MDRRAFLAGAVALAEPHVAQAQPAGKVWRIGILGATPPTAPGGHLWRAFLDALRELGYAEGRNIVLEQRYGGNQERLAALVDDLVRLKVDVIVAGATPAADAAARATTTIPIVMTNHSDPVGSGLVASLAQPGRNVTGLSIINPELSGKRLEILREALPRAGTIAVLWNPVSPVHARMLDETDAAARALGIRAERLAARGHDDYEGAFAAMARMRAQALVVLGDLTFWRHRARLAELAIARRMPAIFAQREHVEAGGLLSYGPDLRDSYRRAAVYVDRILKGAKPADLPVEQPTKFELMINLKTAKALALTIPQSLLLRADQVIE